MKFLNDPSQFHPEHDGKIPLRQDLLSRAIRLLFLLVDLMSSRYPGDLITWLKSMYFRNQPLVYPVPWLTFNAIREIQKHVKHHVKIFEYGAGNSTIFWSSLGAQVFSVESDQNWFSFLSTYIKSQKLPIKLYFEEMKHAYINSILQTGITEFDIVIVDGAFRKECIKIAVNILKPGGLLVVDNTDWHWFQNCMQQFIPQHWRSSHYVGYAPMLGHKSQTSIWFKPLLD